MRARAFSGRFAGRYKILGLGFFLPGVLLRAARRKSPGPLLSLPQTAVRVTRADPGHMRLFLENDDAGATSPGGAAGGTPAGLVS